MIDYIKTMLETPTVFWTVGMKVVASGVVIGISLLIFAIVFIICFIKNK